jgi:hypothetical protein
LNSDFSIPSEILAEKRYSQNGSVLFSECRLQDKSPIKSKILFQEKINLDI